MYKNTTTCKKCHEVTPGPNRKERRAEPKKQRAYFKAKKISDMRYKDEKEARKQKEKALKMKSKKK